MYHKWIGMETSEYFIKAQNELFLIGSQLCCYPSFSKQSKGKSSSDDLSESPALWRETFVFLWSLNL